MAGIPPFKRIESSFTYPLLLILKQKERKRETRESDEKKKKLDRVS